MAGKYKYDAGKLDWDAKTILALRKHLEMTQEEMAGKLGTRQQTISEWEKGMYQPRGASAKLLTIVAEGSKFKYDTAPIVKGKK
ncbi:MAG: helix-turn-helix domain-containing protein [Dehalococcoidales bacterium]|nr:helix-turn-helix domain-containing protein [Dehalococcoidales bacterium]